MPWGVCVVVIFVLDAQENVLSALRKSLMIPVDEESDDDFSCMDQINFKKMESLTWQDKNKKMEAVCGFFCLLILVQSACYTGSRRSIPPVPFCNWKSRLSLDLLLTASEAAEISVHNTYQSSLSIPVLRIKASFLLPNAI